MKCADNAEHQKDKQRGGENLVKNKTDDQQANAAEHPPQQSTIKR